MSLNFLEVQHDIPDVYSFEKEYNDWIWLLYKLV